MLLVVSKFLDLGVQSILLQLKLLRLLAQNLVTDLSFKTIHCLLEKNEQSARAVELVDQLIAFLEQACRNDVLDILRLVANAPIELCDFLIFDVNQVQVMLLLLAEQITT